MVRAGSYSAQVPGPPRLLHVFLAGSYATSFPFWMSEKTSPLTGSWAAMAVTWDPGASARRSHFRDGTSNVHAPRLPPPLPHREPPVVNTLSCLGRKVTPLYVCLEAGSPSGSASDVWVGGPATDGSVRRCHANEERRNA